MNKVKDISVSVQRSLQGMSVKQKYQVLSNMDSAIGGEIGVGREGWMHKREGRGEALNKVKDISVSVQTSLQGMSVKQKYQVLSNMDSTVDGEIGVGRERWVH